MAEGTNNSTMARAAPWLNGAMGVVGAAACVAAWINTKELGHLLAAAGFAAMAPVWYLRPVFFDSSLDEASRRERGPLPGWALACSLAGMALIGIGLLMRWVF
jgi:NAD(P)H-dependent flavin oxidoreductase YrpB (nitropropane dioxygenase family)